MTQQLPTALGPYRLSVDAGEFVFLSGQVGVNPATGELIGETIEIQTKQALENLKAVLASQGLTLSNVVKTTLYLADMGDFSTVNKIYGDYFTESERNAPTVKSGHERASRARQRRATADFPARATVAVKQLPKNARFEIEAIAMRRP